MIEIIKEAIPLFKPGSTVDELFTDLLDEMNAYNTSTNILEKLDNGAHQLHIDLPGISKEDIEMYVDVDSIVIEAERKGFRATSFQKRYKVPQGTALDRVSAKHENGVLIVFLPRGSGKCKPVDIK